MLDSALKGQVESLFSGLEHSYTLHIESSAAHPKRGALVEFLSDFASCSARVECKVDDVEDDADRFGFHILRDDVATGILFRAVPSGHEFSSLIIAILNLDGKGKNLPDEFTLGRIVALSGMVNLTTYMSLTCPNCPDVVQALNLIAMSNDRITHSVVDGALFGAEVERLNIQSVPTVYADGELLHVGRSTLADLLGKLEDKYGSEVEDHSGSAPHSVDVAIAGGGPSGATAAIYLARKGLRVAVVTDRVGGLVNETIDIENIPSIPKTTGPLLAQDLMSHMSKYPTIELLEHRTIEGVDLDGEMKVLHLRGGESVEARQLIIATGAQWRKIGVDGESEYTGRGVAYCPHCDGPLFEGKRVAVIGGGNSGAEGALDLAGICSNVTVVEFDETLRADEVLQERLRSLPNVDIITNCETTRIVGDGSRVTSLEVRDRASGDVRSLDLEGIFVQIGLVANSSLFQGKVECNDRGEVVVDGSCRSSVAMVYGAGDVTDVGYKQIIISMGEGAKAALAAFDDRLRH